jgi:hypothetical protein
MATDWHCHECNTLHRDRCPAEVRATNAAKKK